ncbi:MAG: DUF5681 domain-containing protein [Pseudomonadota bacterium]
MTDRNNGSTTGRDALGQFTSGNSGRPRGARHKTSVAVETLLEGEAEGLTRKAVELALAGDVTALRLCLERICPVRKDAPISFSAPEMNTASDAVQAMGQVLEQVSSGDLTPDEAKSVAALIERFRKAYETEELESRISALEAAK